jgi:hypothetical protein
MAVSAVLQLTFLGLALTEQQHVGMHASAHSGAGLDAPLLGTSAQTGTGHRAVKTSCDYNQCGF